MPDTIFYLVPEPLTPEAFASFGEIITHQKQARQQLIDDAFEADDEGTVPTLTLMWIDKGNAFPMGVEKLERHPHSAQSFVPLDQGRCIIVACGTLPDGAPDQSSLRAFVSAPGQGVLYKRNVWHKGVTPLADDAQFAMVMMKTPNANDTLFAMMETRVEVVSP